MPYKTIIFNRLRIYYQHKSQKPQPAELAVNCEFSLKWPLKLDTNVLSSDRLYFAQNVLKHLIYGWGLANVAIARATEKEGENEHAMALLCDFRMLNRLLRDMSYAVLLEGFYHVNIWCDYITLRSVQLLTHFVWLRKPTHTKNINRSLIDNEIEYDVPYTQIWHILLVWLKQ